MNKDHGKLLCAVITELSKNTLSSYVKKAVDSAVSTGYLAGANEVEGNKPASNNHYKVAKKRSFGVKLAMQKAAGIARVKPTVEQKPKPLFGLKPSKLR